MDSQSFLSLQPETGIASRCDSRFEGIAVFSGEGKLLWMNRRMERLLEIDSATVTTLDRLAELLFPDTHYPAARLERLHAIGNTPSGDSPRELRKANGETIWCRMEISRISGKPDICVHLVDCTGVPVKNQPCWWDDRHFRDIFEASKDAISISGSVRLVNQAWLSLFGYDRHELDALDPRSLYVNPEDRAAYLRELENHGCVRDYPVRLRRRDGVEMDCLYTATLHPENGGNSSYILGFIRDVTREKQAIEAFRRSDDRFRNLFEDSKDAISFYSPTERLVNRAWSDLLGYTQEEIAGLDIMKLYRNPGDRFRYEREMEEKGFVRDFEIQLVRKDGSIIDCLSTAFVHEEKDGRKYYQGILRNITAQKAVLNALRESEDQYRTLFEDSKDAIILYSPSRRRVNRAWVEMTGYTEEEAQTLDFDCLYTDPEVRKRFFREMETNGFTRDFAVKIRNKSGRELDCLSTATVYRNTAGGEKVFQCIIRDITPLQHMLEALRKSEEKYRHLVENIREVIYSVDNEGIITYISPVIQSVSGYRADELIGRQLADVRLVYPSDLPVVQGAFRNVLEGESGVHEFRFLSKWGEVIWFSASVYADRNEGEVVGFHGILADITGAVQAEKVLQESQNRMRAFLDSATEGFFLFDSNLNLAEINWKAQQEFGLKKGAVLGKPLSVLLKAIRFPVSTAVFVNVLKTGEPATQSGLCFGSSFMDFKIFRMGNGIGIIAVNITEQKNAAYALEKARAELEKRVAERTEDLSRLNRNLEQEISERKRAQEALSRRERELDALLNNLVDIAWFKDAESRYILANLSFADWVGVDPGFLKDRMDIDLWPRELAEKYVADDIRAMQTGETLRMEEPILDRQGRPAIFETIKSALHDAEGNTIGTVGIARDITERKRIEEVLRQSEERLKLAMESSEEGIWDWDIAGRRIFWSPRIPLMMGYSPAEFQGRIEDIFLRIHPDDRTRIRKAVTMHLRGETSFCVIEYRVRCKDGSWKWMQDKGRVVFRGDTGNPVRMTGTHRDVTERKQTEEILRVSEERYRAIFENAGVALLELELSAVKAWIDLQKQNGESDILECIQRNPRLYRELYDLIRVVEVNQKTLDMYEAKSREELWRTIDAHFSDELVPFMTRLMKAIVLNEPGMQIEFLGTTLRGKKRYVLVNASIPSLDDRFNRVLISITDLTERKAIEDELRRTHDELEIRVRERTKILACTNLELEREILEREATEQALRESEERYRTLFETSIDAIVVTGPDFRCLGVNRAWLDLFGISESDPVTFDLVAFFVDRHDYGKVIDRVAAGGEVRDCEVRLRKTDGNIMECLLSMTAWKNGEGETIGYQVLIRDITQRKEAERILKGHVEFQQHISSISANFINLPIEDIDTGIRHTLRVLCEYCGVDRGLVIEYHNEGESYSLVHEWCTDGIARISENSEKLPNTWKWTVGRLRQHEIVHVPSLDSLPPEAWEEREACRRFGVRSYIGVPMIHGGKLIGVLGLESLRREKHWKEESIPLLKLAGEMLVNALDRRKAGREVLLYQEKLRSVASELTLTEERERRRIAVELHDRIGQTLALSKIKLGGIREKVSLPDTEKKIDEVSELIHAAISDTRSLMFEISPPVLYDLGLESALEWLTEQVHQQHGIQTEFRVTGGEMMYGDNLRILLFQFVRELLVNVVKHARAKTMDVTVHRLGSEVRIEVTDDGVGCSFDVNEIRPTLESGFGHFSIRERLDHLGGRFHIESAPGRGTRVSLAVPIGNPD